MTVSPTLLSVSVSWTRLPNFDAFAVFLKYGSMIRRLASLHWLQLGAVRQLLQYYQDAMTPCCRPAALRFLRLAVPRLHSLVSLPDGRVRRQGLELVIRYLRRKFAEERTGFSQVPVHNASFVTKSKGHAHALIADVVLANSQLSG